jgi:hypothetical protein
MGPSYVIGSISQMIIGPIRSYRQQQLLHMHGPILWDRQHISDNYLAHPKLTAAAAAANARAYPMGSAAYLRQLFGPSEANGSSS